MNCGKQVEEEWVTCPFCGETLLDETQNCNIEQKNSPNILQNDTFKNIELMLLSMVLTILVLGAILAVFDFRFI